MGTVRLHGQGPKEKGGLGEDEAAPPRSRPSEEASGESEDRACVSFRCPGLEDSTTGKPFTF